MTTVDIHSHVVLPDTFGKAGKYGPSIFVDGEEIVIRVGDQDSRVKLDEERLARAKTDPDDVLRELAGGAAGRIAAMDAQGIDIMGVTISPLFYLYWAEPDIAAEFCQIQNDALADYCRDYPDRFFFMPTLPLQDVDAAVDEIDRTIGKLAGKAINLGGANLGGKEIDDPQLWPVYAKAVEYDVPLFLHPYPEHLADHGTDDYNLSWVIGYLHQETEAFVRFIYGGVLDEFPTLKICIPHGGGFVPYQMARINAFAPLMPGVRCRRPPSEYLDNFYFDALVHDPRARRLLVDVVGVDHVVWGSNFGSPQDKADPRFLDDIGLTDDERARILGGNAWELFKLGKS